MASFQEIINSNIPTLVDFHATWCGPCKTMSPIIDEVKSELGPSVRILKIDVDKNPAVSTKFKIRGVPTFILFKNGEIVWKESGVIPKRTLLSTIQGSAK
ncbi:MAG: thioredoxin 1 [Flavobacteriaceae bacterium]|jgi:thioredoxin 1